MSVTNRRALLRDLGYLTASTWSLPLGLQLFLPETAAALPQVNGKALNFLVVSFPHGLVNGDWEPKKQADGSLSYLDSAVLAPLQRFREKISVFSGLGHETLKATGNLSPSNAHAGLAASFTGLAAGEGKGGSASLDYLISQALFQSDQVLRLGGFASYNPAQGLDDVQSEICYSGSGESNRLSIISNPQKAIEKAFASLVPAPSPSASANASPAVFQVLLQKQLSRLEKRLAGDERALIRRHQETLASLNQGGDSLSCAARPAFADTSFRPVESAVANLVQRQAEIIAAALGCGSARVASLEILPRSHGSYNMREVIANDARTAIKDISPLLNSTNFHNDIAHKLNMEGDFSGDIHKAFNQAQRWCIEQFAYLLAQLEQHGALSNTLVLVGSELGHPQHLGDAAPFFIAGGGFKLGQHFQYAAERVETYRHSCTPHNHLLLSIAARFGISAEYLGDQRFKGALGVDTQGQKLIES